MIQAVAIALVAGGLVAGISGAAKGVKKVDHFVCRTVTMGHKCVPKAVSK